MFTDRPRREFVKGLLVLAKINGHEISNEVASSYDNGDGFLDTLNNIQPHADETICNRYIDKLKSLRAQDGAKSDDYGQLIEQVQNIKNKQLRNREQLVEQYKDYINKTAQEVDTMEVIDKAFACYDGNASLRSSEGNVLLNRIRTRQAHRSPSFNVAYYGDHCRITIDRQDAVKVLTEAFDIDRDKVQKQNDGGSTVVDVNKGVLEHFTEQTLKAKYFPDDYHQYTFCKQIEDNARQIERLRQQFDEAMQKNSELANQIEDLQQERQQLLQSLESVTTDKEQKARELERANEELERFRVNNDQLHQQITNQNRLLQTKQANNEELSNQLSQIRQQHEQDKRDYEQHKQESEAERQQLINDKQRLRDHYEKAQNELEQYHHQAPLKNDSLLIELDIKVYNRIMQYGVQTQAFHYSNRDQKEYIELDINNDLAQQIDNKLDDDNVDEDTKNVLEKLKAFYKAAAKQCYRKAFQNADRQKPAECAKNAQSNLEDIVNHQQNCLSSLIRQSDDRHVMNNHYQDLKNSIRKVDDRSTKLLNCALELLTTTALVMATAAVATTAVTLMLCGGLYGVAGIASAAAVSKSLAGLFTAYTGLGVSATTSAMLAGGTCGGILSSMSDTLFYPVRNDAELEADELLKVTDSVVKNASSTPSN